MLQYLTKHDKSITHVESKIEQSIVIKMKKSVMCNVNSMLFSTHLIELLQFGAIRKHTSLRK